MRSKTTLKIKGNKVAISILDSYKEYCNFGYPADPKIYVLQANKETLKKALVELDKNIITKSPIDSSWGFQVLENNLLKEGELIFGPEQIYIRWEK